MVATTARNATLGELQQMLSVQHDAKHDAIVPSRAITSIGGTLVIDGMGPDGQAKNAKPGQFVPTEIADGHLAERLGIPVTYLRRCRAERVQVYDSNVNGWLLGDRRNFFVRTFVPDRLGDPGIARGVLSDRFRRIDNLDVVASVLDGIRATGVDARVVECNVSERAMRVRVAAPAIAAYAPKLLDGYTSPFRENDPRWRRWYEHAGIKPGEEPLVFAGFTFTNSEVGFGAVQIVPQITMLKCLNGWTMTRDVLRNVHLGAQLAEGVVSWSDETQQRNLELVKSMTVDAVTTFLDTAYVQEKIDGIEQLADRQLENPLEQITLVGQQLRYSQDTINGIFAHFVRGGQSTAGGFAQAVTSYAQEVVDPDDAWDLEWSTMDALTAAALVKA